MDETDAGGIDTLAFADLSGPAALSVSLTEEAVVLSVSGTANSVTVLRDAAGETGVELIRFGTGAATAFADLLADAPVAPVTVDDTAGVSEDGPQVLIDALANDTGGTPGGGAALALVSVAAPARGVTRIEGGQIVFDPDGAFEFLSAEETATETFGYVIGDGSLTATGSITVTVTGVNDAPVAVNDIVSTEADRTILAINVLANDRDAESDTLGVSAFDTTGTLGIVVDNGDGTFGYDPNGAFGDLAEGEIATDQFLYTLSDGNGGTAVATVSISVVGVVEGLIGTDDGEDIAGTDGDDRIDARGGR